MKDGFISYENIVCLGELAYRANADFTRLEGRHWRPGTIFDMSPSWPGDFPGRGILGLVLLSQSTHRRAAFLDEIMEKLPGMLNEFHYFGSPIRSDCLDEQQLSGNSWFLRAMCEHYLWKKDALSLQFLKDMVRYMILPCKGLYDAYPILSSVRHRIGEMSGSLFNGKDGVWELSSDNGCAFILIDGASHAYQILGDPQLRQVIDEMIGRFLSADLMKYEFQTHATLSATRGILRMYECTGESRYLENAVRIYDFYRSAAMTENYANFNWFGRPDTWTEPCTIIDSMILAMSLWEKTGETKYLQDANSIYVNGMGHAQRPNGGFGCDKCSGVSDVYLQGSGDTASDAYWCCSMRGGEGLSRCIAYSAFQDDDAIYFPMYNTAEMRFAVGGKALVLSERNDFLADGTLTFRILKNELDGPVRLKVFLAEGIVRENVSAKMNGTSLSFFIESDFLGITVSGAAGDSIRISLPVSLEQLSAETSEKYRDHIKFRHGLHLLGARSDKELSAAEVLDGLTYVSDGRYVNTKAGITLEPVNDLLTMTDDEARHSKRQILFKRG